MSRAKVSAGKAGNRPVRVPGAGTLPADGASNVAAPARGMSDELARQIVLSAFEAEKPGYQPTKGELQAVQGVASFDGSYGQWGSYKGGPSHNWGAIQCCLPDKEGNCPPTAWLRDDYDAKTGKRYAVCFKGYDSDLDGARDLLRQLYGRKSVAAVLPTGDLGKIMAAMYDTHYFGGFTTDRTKAILEYAQATKRHVVRLSAKLSEPDETVIGDVPEKGAPPGRPPSPPTEQPPKPEQGDDSGKIAAGLGLAALGGALLLSRRR